MPLPDLAADAAAEAESLGLVTTWETADGPALVVSALTAERLGLELDPVGHWVPRGTAAFRRHQSRAIALETEVAGTGDWSLDETADPRAVDPVAVAIASETTMRAAPAKRPRSDAARNHRDGTIPRPSILLGSGPLWQGPTPDGQVCPVCRGVKIPATAYCLKCDAFGLDHLLPTVVTPPSDKPPPKFRPKIKASAHAHPLT